MLRRVESDEHPETPGLLGALGLKSWASAPVAALGEAEHDAWRLPPDHPKWVKDTVTISSRARELIAKLKPVVVRVLTFWDHRVRALIVGDSRITVDPSGSYRCE